MKHQKVGRGAAFSHGLSRTQEAEAASRNVLSAGLNEDELAAAASNFILSLEAGRPSFTKAVDAQIAARSAPDPAQRHVYHPPALLSPKQMDHHGYVLSLLSSASGDDVLDEIGRDLLGGPTHVHVERLDRMRAEHRQAHHLLVRGDAGGALDWIRTRNTLSPEDRANLASVVTTHVKCFAIRTARLRAEALALFATQPSGSAFAGFTTWKTVGHVMLSTCAAPAKLLQRLIAAADHGVFDHLSDQQVQATLVAQGLVPEDAIDTIMAIGIAARARLRRAGCNDKPVLLRSILHAIGSLTADTARLTQREMQEAGFSRMDMADYRYGLSASEITTYVALELRQAARHIEACVAACLAGASLPDRADRLVSQKSLAYTATIFRADAEADRHAVDLHAQDRHHNNLDRRRNAGARVVKSMSAKLSDKALAASLRQQLAIDATAWFRRPCTE